ncbi:hypothetical protein LSAT2_005133 [Lamellibrachia satsuma]|nr:hypothetical protein LSAT2_005133 [Lamellibrachia satsuma]
MTVAYVLLTSLFVFSEVCGTVGYCAFPTFLWEVSPSGNGRRWAGRIVHAGSTWSQRMEVIVRRTEFILTTTSHNKSCDYHVTAEDCRRDIEMHTVVCLSEEPNGKFRVHMRGERYEAFSCMKFIARSRNVIQVYSAEPHHVNEGRICYDNNLLRQQYMWLATTQIETTFCEVQGGFDFVARNGRTKEELCGGDWRPSRMESDCIKGEGVVFYFTQPNCSLFYPRVTELRLQCWASWQERDHRFVVLADGDSESRYVLRLPRNVNVFDEMTSFVYMSPVAPVDDKDFVSADVMYYKLHMLRSEPGICYDQSAACRQFAAQGKCSSQLYSNFCRRSCRRCDPRSEPRPECRFSRDVQGDWLLLEDDGRSTYAVAVEDATVTFSTLGRFVCKSKHWTHDYVKVRSAYSNGCQNDAGRYLVDLFVPVPISGRVVAETRAMSSMLRGNCGLGGRVAVMTTFSDGTTCNGSLSDVRPTTCKVRPLLRLDLPKCLSAVNEQDLHCSAHVRFDRRTQFLVTKCSTSGLVSCETTKPYETSETFIKHIDIDRSKQFTFNDRQELLWSPVSP